MTDIVYDEIFESKIDNKDVIDRFSKWLETQVKHMDSLSYQEMEQLIQGDNIFEFEQDDQEPSDHVENEAQVDIEGQI